MASGNDHSILLKHDGSVWFSGLNNYGQLGAGREEVSKIFVETLPEGALGVAGGMSHSMILKQDGTVMGTGDNRHGQLGDGTLTNQNFLITVGKGRISNAKLVATGSFHSVVLEHGGRVWVSGWNRYGQLGDGSNFDRNEFYHVDRVGADGVAAGDIHTVVLSKTGSVWAAGSNMYGQLGDSTNIDRNMFMMVLGSWEGHALLVAAGGYHSLMLMEDGSLYATGWNHYGQLGDGTSDDKSKFVMVAESVKRMDAGSRHSVILKLDGSVWTTGYNLYGQLGDGSTTNRRVFEKVMRDSGTRISAGYHHTMVLKRDETVWAAGSNKFGQFGDGTTISKQNFVIVLEPSNSKEFHERTYDYGPSYVAYLRVEDHSGASKNGEEYRRADHCS